MTTNKIKYGILIALILLLSVPYVYAEIDSDMDGIKDEIDACSNTVFEEDMPSTTQKEYIGCSCNQIKDILNSKMSDQCYDLFCGDGRTLSITERILSKDKISCAQDYCMDSVLYEFPDAQQTTCVEGFPQEPSCLPTVKKNSVLCLTGQIDQYDDLQKEYEEELQNQKKLEQFQGLPSLSDQFFELLLEDLNTKNKLNVLNRDDYQNKILGADFIVKNSQIVVLEISGSKVNLTENSITITPPSDTKLENAILVERINLLNLNKEDFVFKESPNTISSDPWIVYWTFDEIKEQKTITYRIKKQVDTQQEVLLLATVKKQSFFWQIIPIMLIVFVFVLTYIWIKNDSEKRRIFK